METLKAYNGIISNVIALLALAISLGNIIYSIIRSRKKLEMDIVYLLFDDDEQPEDMGFVFHFINCSTLPITITGIDAIVNDIAYLCVTSPMNEMTCDHDGFTHTPFPINLGSLAGTPAHVSFSFPKGLFLTAPSHMTFQVRTNRGMVKPVQFSLEKLLQPYHSGTSLHEPLQTHNGVRKLF